MFNITIHRQADKMLVYLSKRDGETYDEIEKNISEIEQVGQQHSQSKKIGSIFNKGIYRVRVGRWRILFIEFDDQIDFWIIEMEKDTKKDYERWIKYIKSQY